MLPIMSTSYFDPNFVRQQSLISSQDGRLLEVEVAYLGPSKCPIFGPSKRIVFV